MTRKAVTLMLTVVVVFVIACTYFEIAHRYNFGHFVPYGLHVDVLSEEVSIGIPGQRNLYRAELSNFTFWPVRLDACNYLTDAFSHGTEYPYAVQRWDQTSKEWKIVVEINGERFCRPVPLSRANTELTSKLLWPGINVEVMDGEATGAREPFQKGDLARFIVFRTVSNEADWKDAIPSHSFVIEDEVPRDDVQFRVKH